jgi:hypothetical protein
MATIRVDNGTHEDCTLAAGVVGKCKVVSCPNPADAASPVTLIAGDYSRQIGQSADYRHDLSGLPAIHEAGALVQSWWDDARHDWYTTIKTDADEQAIRDFVRARERAREAKRQTEDRVVREAEYAARRNQEQQAIDAAIRAVSAAAEAWMPGRVAVTRANDGTIVVGRWDAPYIPGHGQPVEVRRPVRRGDAIDLIAADPSYRFSWA